MKLKLKQFFDQRQKIPVAANGLIRAAVLVPIFEYQGEYHVLFTQRTRRVRDHKGQISFPGGAYESVDGTLLNTALRECHEEIGLTPEMIELLGELDDMPTIGSGYIITPFLAVIPWPCAFKADPIEVAEIFEVPVVTLLDKTHIHDEVQVTEGQEITGLFYHYRDKVIWGATARILTQFLNIYLQLTGSPRKLTANRPEKPEQLPRLLVTDGDTPA